MSSDTSQKKLVGILGMSGDPPHEGHVIIGSQALFRLKLHEVLFMVTPHSPHKDPADYAPLEHRTHLAYLALMSTGRLGSRFKVSDFEAALHRFGEENSTANMLAHFSEVYSSVQPVWLMGADSLRTLHTWGRYEEIMERYPVAVLSRGSSSEEAFSTVAGAKYKERFVPEASFKSIPGTWTFLDGLRHTASSTAIRESLRRGRSTPWLCGDAEAYILQHGLYGVNQSQ